MEEKERIEFTITAHCVLYLTMFHTALHQDLTKELWLFSHCRSLLLFSCTECDERYFLHHKFCNQNGSNTTVPTEFTMSEMQLWMDIKRTVFSRSRVHPKKKVQFDLNKFTFKVDNYEYCDHEVALC